MGKGLYIHIPFCVSKCNYCDFYSGAYSSDLFEKYVDAVIRELENYKGIKVSTLYLGGGTPTVLGERNLKKLLEQVFATFEISGEATLEANPADDLYDVFKTAKSLGINRISLGVQSAVESELKTLGRRHSAADVIKTVEDINKVGIDNYSLDLMLGIPDQTTKTLQKSVEFLVSLNPKHISAYLLKIEEGTPFFKMQNSLNLPDGDQAAELYLKAVDLLEENGFSQYEVSNFAKAGFEAKHNLKYWNCEEYIGIGPSAHGFLDGKRYYYERDLNGFIDNPTPVFDDDGGGFCEYIMLKLRLAKGLKFKDFEKRYFKLPKEFFAKAETFQKLGLVNLTEENLSLTKNGFLVSNTIISELLNCI